MGFVRIGQLTMDRACPANRAVASCRVLRSSEADSDADARSPILYGTVDYRLAWDFKPGPSSSMTSGGRF